MDEICRSNIMQRDNKKFAKKLDKNLAKLAKEKNKTVSSTVCSTELIILVICICIIGHSKETFFILREELLWHRRGTLCLVKKEYARTVVILSFVDSYEEPLGQKGGEKSFNCCTKE